MEIFIIRHGQSCNNARKHTPERRADPALTDLGQRQAAVLAKHSATGTTLDVLPKTGEGASKHRYREGYGVTSLYCSPMYRSLQIAAPIGAAWGIVPKIWVDIHERGGMYRDRGGASGATVCPGMTWEEIREQFPCMDVPAAITEYGWWPRAYEDTSTCGIPSTITVTKVDPICLLRRSRR